MIIHGSEDQLFPPRHALKMYAAAHEPKVLWLIEGLGHQTPVADHQEEFEARVISFFEAAFEE